VVEIWRLGGCDLDVTLVYCGQTVGWIKMKLGTQVGLGPLDTVLDGDSAAPRKGAQQPRLSKFTGAGFACVRIIRDPCLLWPNGWMAQDATWYGGRPRLRRHCVRWGPSPEPCKKRGTVAPHFWAYVYCGQTVAHLSYCSVLVVSRFVMPYLMKICLQF